MRNVIFVNRFGLGNNGSSELWKDGTYYDAVVFLRCSDVFEWLVSLTKMVSLYGLQREVFPKQLGLLQCEEFEINARRLYKAELERTLAKELSGRKTVLVACDDV